MYIDSFLRGALNMPKVPESEIERIKNDLDLVAL